MRILVQRVKSASISVDGCEQASIQNGLLLFVAAGKGDSEEDVSRMAKKTVHLRIFEDEAGKMNLSIADTRGEILSVPQFTLYADVRKGNRPGFEEAEAPRLAEEKWRRFNQLLRDSGISVQEGVFGAHMEVSLVNDGPVTIWLDSKE